MTYPVGSYDAAGMPSKHGFTGIPDDLLVEVEWARGLKQIEVDDGTDDDPSSWDIPTTMSVVRGDRQIGQFFVNPHRDHMLMMLQGALPGFRATQASLAFETYLESPGFVQRHGRHADPGELEERFTAGVDRDIISESIVLLHLQRDPFRVRQVSLRYRRDGHDLEWLPVTWEHYVDSDLHAQGGVITAAIRKFIDMPVFPVHELYPENASEEERAQAEFLADMAVVRLLTGIGVACMIGCYSEEEAEFMRDMAGQSAGLRMLDIDGNLVAEPPAEPSRSDVLAAVLHDVVSDRLTEAAEHQRQERDRMRAARQRRTN